MNASQERQSSLPEPTVQLLLAWTMAHSSKGGLMSALLFFPPLISTPLFPSSLSLCLDAHTPLALFSSKFYLPTQDFRIEFSWSSLGSLVLCRNILSYPTVLMGDK